MAYTEQFQDNFTEASDTALTSHTPDTGTGWTATAGNTGTAQVDAGTDTVVQPYHSGLQHNGFIANKGSAWASNQAAETTGYYGNSVLTAVRVKDGDTDVDGYCAYWLNNLWRIYRCDEGNITLTQIAQQSGTDTSPSTSDVIRLTAETASQSLTINTTEHTASASDETFTGGSPGLITRRTLTANGITSFSGLDEAASGVTASGTPSITAITASGAVETQLGASGTPSIAEITATGLVGHINSASGTPSLADITASGAVQTTLGAYGTATLTAITSTGNVSTTQQVVEASGTATATAITASGNSYRTTVTITVVDGDNTWDDGSNGLVITGTNFVN